MVRKESAHKAEVQLSSISELPNVPAVYALYGGEERGHYVAYVGIASNLKRRVVQHLVNRDSSVATGTSAVNINPDYVTGVGWWEHSLFRERRLLEAAELVAFEVLEPVLRSRGVGTVRAKQNITRLLTWTFYLLTC
jgi:predicted GIY-YIG superfamily endonuclease